MLKIFDGDVELHLIDYCDVKIEMLRELLKRRKEDYNKGMTLKRVHGCEFLPGGVNKSECP